MPQLLEPSAVPTVNNVDPTQAAPSMQGVDVGDAGRQLISEAQAAGWTPESGVPAHAYLTQQATAKVTSQMAQELNGVKSQVAALSAGAQRDIKADYDKKIRAAAKAGKPTLSLIEEMNAELAKAANTTASGRPSVASNETIAMKSFKGKYTFMATPQTADDHSLKAWTAQRAQELETKHPGATEEQILTQLDAELAAKGAGKPTSSLQPTGRELNLQGSLGNGATPGAALSASDVAQLTAEFNASPFLQETFATRPNGKGGMEAVENPLQAYLDEFKDAQSGNNDF